MRNLTKLLKNKLSLSTSLIAGWIVYQLLFWRKALFFDNGALVAGHINIWGDWAAHMTMVTNIAVHGIRLDQSPFLIGARFSYPFAINAISAGLLRLGFDLIPAMVLPSFVFSVALLIVVLYFYRALFSAQGVAVLAALIFILNGGIGWWYYLQDVSHSSAPLQTILEPAHEYTRLDEHHIKWMNIIDSMVIPQRSFTMGFTIAVLGTLLVLAAKRTNTWQYAVAAGIVLGNLPVIHMHSFLAVGIILSCWSGYWLISTPPTKRLATLQQLGVIAILAGMIGLAWWKLIYAGHVGGSFLKWYPGWLAREFTMNWLLFWWKNWGVTPLLSIVGWAIAWRHNRSLFWYLAPFFLLFVLANLILFQPFTWDNTKIIVWANVGMAGAAAYTLSSTWQVLRKSARPQSYLLSAGLVLIGALTVASGVLDAYWILRHDLHSYTMHSAEEVALAVWVQEHTEPDSIWLTGENHNHWLFNITGRQAIMTYRGWLWTHGYEYRQTERDLSAMFSNPQDNLHLFKEYAIDYAVVGPNERQVWAAQRNTFESLFQPIKSTDQYTVYRVE